MKKEIIRLSSGREGRCYCAFPSIVGYNGRILCAWKQGIGHADSGDTAYLEMTPDGSVVLNGEIENIDGAIYQNTELLTLPDGKVICWIDKQDSHNKRLGAVAYEYTGSEFRPLPGILTDTNGTKYGYVFDGMLWNGRYYLIAMTFPELDPEIIRKTVEILSSDDCVSWKDELCLDTVCDLPLNESSFAALGDEMFVLCRSYRKEAAVIALDKGMNVLSTAVYGLEDGICRIGRPKLFTVDGELYAIMRNHRTEDAAEELALLKLNTNDLTIRKYTTLDNSSPEDGYYAEPFFNGSTFNIITYAKTGEHCSDILLMKYEWDELS